MSKKILTDEQFLADRAKYLLEQQTIEALNGEPKLEEVSMEMGNQSEKLTELLAKKAHEKLQLTKIEALHVLKKSKFYYTQDKKVREHLANYKGYAILIKQEHIKEDINDKEMRMFPALVTLPDLRKMKKINGNIVRKLQPQSLHEFQKLALIQGVISEIDKGV